MNLLEKYPHIKPETIKPIRYATDWGTRLFFHPSLFPGIQGNTYDVLDDNGHLHESVTYEDGKFSHAYLQQHPTIQAWSPTEKVLHGYELEDFYKSCEAIIKFNQAGAVGELKRHLPLSMTSRKRLPARNSLKPLQASRTEPRKKTCFTTTCLTWQNSRLPPP